MAIITLEVGVPLSGYPFTSIASAIAYMRATDPAGVPVTNTWIIDVHAGTYFENVDLIDTLGTATNPVTLQAHGNDVVVVDGGVGTTVFYAQLTADIDAVVATIPLSSVTGFPTSGIATINGEVITYTGISGLNLTGAVRPSGITHLTNDYVCNGLSFSVNYSGAANLTIDGLKVVNYLRDGVVGFSLQATCKVRNCKAYSTSPYARAFTVDGIGGFNCYLTNCFADVAVTCPFIYQVAGSTSPLFMDNLTFVGHGGGMPNTGEPIGSQPPIASNYSIGVGGVGSVVRNCHITNGYIEDSGTGTLIDSNWLDQSGVFGGINPVVTNNIFLNTQGVKVTIPYGGWYDVAFSIAVINIGLPQIFNNTINDPLATAPIIFTNTPVSGIVKNNIIQMSVAGYAVLAYANVPALDSNCYYMTGSASLQVYFNGVNHTSLGSMQAVGQEIHGIVANPLFVAPSTPVPESFKVQSNSPCNNAGVALSGIVDGDYFGNLRPLGGHWDIGFSQHSPQFSYPIYDATMPILPKLYQNAGRRFARTYARITYSLMYIFARALSMLGVNDFLIAMNQLNVNTATGNFLELWGSYFGTRRYPNETDAAFSQRIIANVLTPRTIKQTILDALYTVEGVVTVEIFEGNYAAFFVGYSYIGYAGSTGFELLSDLIVDTVNYSTFYFTVILTVKGNVDYQQILNAINDNKAGGVKYTVIITQVI